MIDLNATGAGLDGYTLLQAQLESLLADERDFIANAAQFKESGSLRRTPSPVRNRVHYSTIVQNFARRDWEKGRASRRNAMGADCFSQ